jgi:phosphopantothenoylcysteine synthetase/decarboxylase
MKRILIAVTGGISAYKSVDVMSALKKSGYHISAMATDSALKFVAENVLQITADKYWKHTWDAPIHIQATDPMGDPKYMPRYLAGFVIVPATANIIAKIVNGIADDLVSSTVLALPEQTVKMICPACNTRMWENPVVQKNVNILKEELGWKVLPPAYGLLACGTEGIGKLPSTREIVNFVIKEMQ